METETWLSVHARQAVAYGTVQSLYPADQVNLINCASLHPLPLMDCLRTLQAAGVLKFKPNSSLQEQRAYWAILNYSKNNVVHYVLWVIKREREITLSQIERER